MFGFDGKSLIHPAQIEPCNAIFSPSDADLAWTGPAPQWWAEQFSTTTELAQALVCAAVRETFEECGVLLASSGEEFPDPATLRHA